MVQNELEAARREAERLESAATSAEAARVAQAAALDQLKAKGKSRASALRVQVESEACIVQEQQRYVDSLSQRAAAASELKATDDEEASRLRVKELVVGGGAAASGELANVDAAKKAADDELEAASAALVSLEARAASNVAALREQVQATREAVVQLAEYEGGLSELLNQGMVSVDKAPPPVPLVSQLSARWGGAVAGSRVSLLTSEDVVTVTESSARNSQPDPKPPPDPRRCATRLRGDGRHRPGDERPARQAHTEEGEVGGAGGGRGAVQALEAIANAVSPRASAEAEAKAAAEKAEAEAAKARQAAVMRSESAEKAAKEEVKKQSDSAKAAATAKAEAAMAASGKSEVETWLGQKGLLAVKKGLADAGVTTLLELANMEPPDVRKATAGVDAATRSKLMNAIDAIEID